MCLLHHHRCHCRVHHVGVLGLAFWLLAGLFVAGWFACAYLARRGLALTLLVIEHRHDPRALLHALTTF